MRGPDCLDVGKSVGFTHQLFLHPCDGLQVHPLVPVAARSEV